MMLSMSQAGQLKVFFVASHFFLLLSGVLAEADLQTRLHDLSWADLSCLRQEPKGCAVLQDQFSCLSSKSGDEAPCIWCSGGPCLAGRLNRCESLPIFKGAEETAMSGNVELPACDESGAASVFKKGRPDVPAPSQEQLSKLTAVAGGCMSVKDMSTCLSSKDGSGNATWGYTPYKVAGEACVWCGGVPCTDANTALCMPFDLLMNGQGPHHDVFYAKHTFKVAEVKESKVVFPPSDLSCLSMDNKGCPALLNAYDCLQSADGRPDETIFGRKVHGQPCVWCKDKMCNEKGAKCEPYDLQMNGEGYAFITSYSKDPMVAQCKDGRVKPHFNVTKPVLNLPKPRMDKLECLTMKSGGCKTITDKLTCLSSRDGSETDSEGGLAIRGQPCVWCGGGSESPKGVASKCVAGKSSKNAGREYWSCSSCDFFQWLDQAGTTLSAAGPPCRCGHPSQLKITKKLPNRGRSFWTCASTGGSSCNFFRWEVDDWEPEADLDPTPEQKCKKCQKAVQVKTVGEHNQKGNAGRKYYSCKGCGAYEFVSPKIQAPPSASGSQVGSAEYVVDEITRRELQRLFDIPFGTKTGIGRDQREDEINYDYLKVECAWRVSNPQREKRYADFLKNLTEVPQDARVPSKLLEAQAPLVKTDAAKNEMLLLHGTKPSHLYDILFEGLDPHLSLDGLFGKGTYLAEDAAKIDQYLTKDPAWKGNLPDHELHLLHKKLYERGVKHAGDVFYALVCRVALGEPVVTEDGTTGRDGEKIFQKSRSTLKGGKTSLVAELGDKLRRFREFVIFDPAALSINYLVALKRVRHYCDCGQTAAHRTVVNGRPENFGREILRCPQSAEDGGCKFFQMLPQCYCGRSAEVAEKRNGEKYYRCGAKRGFCDFKDWNGPPKRLRQ